MAILTMENASIVVDIATTAAADLTTFNKEVVVNWGQETKDASAHGNTHRVFRAGTGNVRINARFHCDYTTGGPYRTFKDRISTTSTGFNVEVRPTAYSATNPVSATNPMVKGQFIIDGDLSIIPATYGEIGEISVTLVPYSAISVQTTATS